MARKNTNRKEAWFEDALGQKYIAVISLCAILGMGIWMLVDPSGGKHANYERSTVYLIKELWSFNMGLILSGIAILFIIRTILRIRIMNTFTWVKSASGYYLMKNKTRIAGLESMYDGPDLIVFNPANNEVYRFPNYLKTKLNKYKKVVIDNRFNCTDAYWSADKSGYFLFYKGLRLNGLTSEYRGEDLIVSSASLGKKFRLSNYRSNQDNKIRSAERY